MKLRIVPSVIAVGLAGLLPGVTAHATSPPSSGTTPVSGTTPAGAAEFPVIELSAAAYTGDDVDALRAYLGIDQSDLGAALTAAGAPQFTPIVKDAILLTIDTDGSIDRYGSELVWTLAKGDPKALFDELVTALEIPADFETNTGNRTSDGRVSYYGEFEKPSSSDAAVTIDRYRLSVLDGEKATMVQIGTSVRHADDSPAPEIPVALTAAAGDHLDVAAANAALTIEGWTYSLGSSFLIVLGSEQEPRWDVDYTVADATPAEPLATELCAPATPVNDDDYWTCGDDAGRNVRVSPSFDDPTMAREVTVGNPRG